MKVILLQDVKKLGKKDEVVTVSDGYANNYLFKNNLAVISSSTSDKKLEEKKALEAEKRAAKKAEAEALKAELEAREFEFKLKTGVNGNVFGSISSKQVITKLRFEGYKNIDKKMIISEPVSHVGYDTVKIQLHKEVVAEVKILIKGE
ncbi:50S ribosomal protein L9 [Mollicutes bacterium LVI A0039]|nr:50S ribosomal protein L9 [Mollicutes bacterium LVI A0039]